MIPARPKRPMIIGVLRARLHDERPSGCRRSWGPEAVAQAGVEIVFIVGDGPALGWAYRVDDSESSYISGSKGSSNSGSSGSSASSAGSDSPASSISSGTSSPSQYCFCPAIVFDSLPHHTSSRGGPLPMPNIDRRRKEQSLCRAN